MLHQTSELPELLPDFLNAERSPYTGQLSTMDRDDRLHYDKFIDGIVRALAPAGALEEQLAFSIAADYWRLNRMRNIEEGIFALCHPNPTGEFGSKSIPRQIAESQTSAFLLRQSHFKFLSTYEMRLQRTMNRNKAELKEVQAERRKLDAAAKEHEAGLAAAPAPCQTADGFAFSETSAPAATGPRPPIQTRPTQTGNGFAFSNRRSLSKRRVTP